MINPNILLKPIPWLVALGLGVSACTVGGGEQKPTTSPQGSAIKESWRPVCDAVEIQANPQDPRSVSMRLQTKNDEVAGVQYVRHANFDFGDNTPDATSAGLSTQHRYENPGKYDINASFTVEVAPNVQGTVPNGYIVDCPVKSVTIN